MKNLTSIPVIASRTVIFRTRSWHAAVCGIATSFSVHNAHAQATVTQLAPVVVQSTLAPQDILQTPASVSRLDAEDIRTGRPALDLSELLAAVPGMQAQNRHNAAQDLQVSIRGFGARSTFGIRGIRIYVDGIPATMPDGQGQLSNIDLASAASIEVLRGPYSALYGNSSGGVLSIETAPGEGPPTLQLDGLTGSDGLRRAGVQMSGAAASVLRDWRVSVNRSTADGWRDHSAMRKNIANARLGFALGDASTVTLSANAVDLHADDPLGLNAADFHARPRSVVANAVLYNTRKTVKQTQLGLKFDTRINARHTLQAMIYGGARKTVQYQAIPNMAQIPAGHAGGVIDLKRTYGGVDLRWIMQGEDLDVTAGLAWDAMRETRRGFENFLGLITAPTRRGVQGRLRRDERNTLENIDPYLQASWALSERWTMDAGMRLSTVRFRSRDHYIVGNNGDDSGSARYQKWLPVVALRYAVSDATSVYATAGRGFETPTFNELSYRPDGLGGLNFSLRPSTSRNIEIGAKTRALGGLLSAALFRIDTRDEIVSATNTGGRATFRNAADSRRHGVELAWSGEVAQDLRASVSATWLDAVLRNPQGTDGRRIPGVARQSAYASLTWAPPQGWQAGVEWRALSKIEANTQNTAQAAGYAVTGVFAGYKAVWDAWELGSFVRVDNVFDRRYAGSVIVNEGNNRFYEPAATRHWSVAVTAGVRF